MWSLVRRGARASLITCLLLLMFLLLVGLIYFCSPQPTKVNQQRQQQWLLLSADRAAAGEDSGDLATSLDELEESSSSSNQAVESFSSNTEKRANVTNQSGRRIRRLAVDRRPILNEFSFPANLVQGMRFVLMCQVLDGDLPIQIKWFKDQQELLDYSAPTTSQQQPAKSAAELEIELLSNDELGSSLLFRKVQQKHSGNYTCLAKNHLGSTSYSSSLSVKIPPKWRLEPQDQTESIIGEQATIDCQAEGNPNPFIRWKFSPLQQQQAPLATNSIGAATSQHHPNGLLMAQEASFKLINSNHHIQTLENGSLAIRLVGKDDEGLYQCEADNGLEPSLAKSLRLIVHQQAQIIDDLRLLGQGGADLAPATSSNSVGNGGGNLPVIRSVRLLTSSSNATSQQQLRVLCQPVGDLPLTVDWLKDDQLIYTHTIQQQSIDSPDLQQQQQQQQQQHQQLGRLHVNTRRSNVAATGGGVRLESELYLTGLRRSDAGMFACFARNAYGRADRRMKLLLQEPPEPPEVVDVSRIGSRSISLRWLPSGFDGNSPILRYIVEYRRLVVASPSDPRQTAAAPSGQQQQQQQWIDEQLLSQTSSAADLATGQSERILLAADQQQQQPMMHTVHELEPLARYSMRVIAVNAVGRSRPSVALTLRTEEEVPSVIPTPVVVVVLSSRSVRLRWTLGYSLEREIIDGFFIGYKSTFDAPPPPPSLAGLDLRENQRPDPMTTAAQSTGGQLQPPTFTYKTVRLSSDQQQQQQQQQDPGSAYISPLSSMTKTISQTTNGNLQQQVVQSTFEYVIGGLERNTEYSILIQCFNKKGAGPTSDPEIFRTFANDPPEKLALSADEISESSVRVNWRFMSPPPSIATAATEKQYNQLVDGFVLSFAKLLSHQQQPRALISGAGGEASRLSAAIASARIAQNPNHTIDQWQSIQLAPQQRSHQLKNLECGTSYAMKIWAFNKIGKGEPSDQVTVSTRGKGGSPLDKLLTFNYRANERLTRLLSERKCDRRPKAPIAPDRRSFLSINSTQVRLHLSAWYDGGCEIDKFIVQYKIRGQQQSEWTLVSNNIQREQLSVVIRDLLPATSYELLVGAQNQVGPTEVKYRFQTLDLEGKQVASSELFASPSADGDSGGSMDYPLQDGGPIGADGTRREFWPPDGSMSKSMLLARQLMNSPLALVMSLCFFVVLLMVLIFYKFNAQPNSQSSPSVSTLNLNPSNKSSSGGRASSSGIGEQTMMANDGELIGGGGGGSNTMSGFTDSPLTRMSTLQQPQQSIRLLNSTNNNGNYSPVPESCHYQPFCNPTIGGAQNQEYSHYGLPSSTYDPAPGAGQIYSGLAAPQRSATMDQVSQSSSSMMADQERSRQLIQMLMMQQQQNQSHCLDQIPENAIHHQSTNSYAAATLARATNRGTLKLNNGNHPAFQSNTLGRASSSNCNNNFLEQTRRPADGQYPMSTFKQSTPTTGGGRDPDAMTNETTHSCSTATSSTSGRGTSRLDTSIAAGSLNGIDPQPTNICDTRTSPYDVPFKFTSGVQTTNHHVNDDNMDAAVSMNTICY